MTTTPNPEPKSDPVDEALHELLQIGMMAARTVGAQVATAYSTDPAQVVALERVGRLVRRTALLIRKFAEPPAPHRAANAVRRRTEARARIIREVEDAIHRREGEHPETPEHAETLRAELAERLDAPDFDDELDARPTADIILDVHHDLGLEPTPANTPGAHPHPRRTPAQVRHLRQRAAQHPATPQSGTTPGHPHPTTDPPPPDH